MVSINKLLSKENRALFSELVRTDFKLRYQGSALGYTWSLLRPLFMFIILYIVFAKFLRVGDAVPNYPIYLLLGIVLWQFFGDMTNQSLSSIVGRGDLIRKIRIPRWMIVITSSASAVINLGLNMIVVVIFMAIIRAPISLSAFWIIIAILEIYLFGLGLSLILATAFVKYRDVSFIWEVLMQAGFYVTPVLYPMALITNINAQKLILLNPMAQAIQDARSVLVTTQTQTIAEVWGSGFARVAPVLISLIFLSIGVLYFKKEASYFAENL